MAIEKIISNKYNVLKLVKNDLNYMYVADGPLMKTSDVHDPGVVRDIDWFAQNTFKDHIDYLESKGCAPRNAACMFMSFSYTPTYESALLNRDEIWRTQRLSDEEIVAFERGIAEHSKKYWNNKSPPLR